MVASTWSEVIVTDVGFCNIELLDGMPGSGTETLIGFHDIPTESDRLGPDGNLQIPSYGTVIFNRPVKKARIRVERGPRNNHWIFLTTPYGTINSSGVFDKTQTYSYSDSVDEAPKILTSAPKNNYFAVATAARINRSSFCTWLGRADSGIMWGRSNYQSTFDVVLSDYSLSKQTAPDAYKFAFILVTDMKKTDSPGISSGTIQALDEVRRYWDATFENATLGLRHSDSRL